MKTRIFLSLLGFASLLSAAKSACDLTGSSYDVAFPDIMKNVADSYIMGVEYSVPGATQTDYYTEYYEVEFKRGRVDSHISGKNQQYIYRSETWEAWTLEDDNCKLQNITLTPEFFKSVQTDWLHYTPGMKQPTTVGPSAMLKAALDAWKGGSASGKMGYMGRYKGLIRGEKAVYWRRCIGTSGYADYFFADSSDENPFDTDLFKTVVTPLRVTFTGLDGVEEALATQNYDILSFQHVIPKGVEPFQLPKGRNCQRGGLVDGPKLPNFSKSNLLLYAEVVYSKYSTKDHEKELLSSYYSTLMFALDREINHLAYYYSSWNTTKTEENDQEPFVEAPEYVVFDTLHAYKYKTSFMNAKCEISRTQSFIPQFKLPEDGGSIALTDPTILFPNDELTYLSEGTDRGLAVDIFETEMKDYVLDIKEGKIIPRAIISHSYLKFNEQLENTVEVTNAPTQMQLQLFSTPNTREVLTFNIFGFTTRLSNKRQIFDLTRCFKNDDDYTFLTIGFEIPPQYLKDVQKRLSDIEMNTVTQITLSSELNAARIPAVMTDMKRDYVYVTMMVLGKPPLQLDFPNIENGKSIVVENPDQDSMGIADFDTCATSCLEQRVDCWGFSMCGATCYFGSPKNTKVSSQPDCNVYRRYDEKGAVMISKELQVENILHVVEANEFNIMVALDSGERIELTATYAVKSEPAEDDTLFEKMGHKLNPRMRVVNAGTKLVRGDSVKNMGKLRFDECQSLCLDFKECETLSYCLIDGNCKLSSKYAKDLKDDDTISDPFCNLVTRKYTDHFDRTPGVFVAADGGTDVDEPILEDCARECLKQGKDCLSFDHCAGIDHPGCKLYKVHFINRTNPDPAANKNPRCGHYTRKYSLEFDRRDNTLVRGSKIPPITNLTLEACAKTCYDYANGKCSGYNFCQGKSLYETSCILLEADPSGMKFDPSATCTNYINSFFKKEKTIQVSQRAEEKDKGKDDGKDDGKDSGKDGGKDEKEEEEAEVEIVPRPFSNSYAGGIGFLCFLVGGIIGAAAIFVIAYIRVNRRR